MVFGFWNIHRNNLSKEVAALAHERALDVMILAEGSQEFESATETALLGIDPSFERWKYYSPLRFSIWSRVKCRPQPLQIDNPNRMEIWALDIHSQRFLLVIYHGLDLRNHEKTETNSEIQEVARKMREIAAEQGIERIVIVGDMNVNPFDDGLVGFHHFHATMDKGLAAKSRKFASTERMRFYNPMWNFLGDETAGPPGTYHRGPSGPVQLQWFMLDQVLISGPQAHWLSGVEIVTEVNGRSLQTSLGYPNKSISDHFPITFAIERPKE